MGYVHRRHRFLRHSKLTWLCRVIVQVPVTGQKRRSGKRAPAGARLGEESPRIGPRFFEPGELYAMSAGHLVTPGPASRDRCAGFFFGGNLLSLHVVAAQVFPHFAPVSPTTGV